MSKKKKKTITPFELHLRLLDKHHSEQLEFQEVMHGRTLDALARIARALESKRLRRGKPAKVEPGEDFDVEVTEEKTE